MQALFPLYGGGNRRLDLCHPGKSQGCGQGRLGGRCENGEGCGYQRLPGFTLEQEEWRRGPRAAVRGKKWGEGLRARQGSPGLGPAAAGLATAAISLPRLLGSSTPNRSTRGLLVPETTSTEFYRVGLFKTAKTQRELA